MSHFICDRDTFWYEKLCKKLGWWNAGVKPLTDCFKIFSRKIFICFVTDVAINPPVISATKRMGYSMIYKHRNSQQRNHTLIVFLYFLLYISLFSLKKIKQPISAFIYERIQERNLLFLLMFLCFVLFFVFFTLKQTKRCYCWAVVAVELLLLLLLLLLLDSLIYLKYLTCKMKAIFSFICKWRLMAPNESGRLEPIDLQLIRFTTDQILRLSLSNPLICSWQPINFWMTNFVTYTTV